jgi:predicted Zn-dependent peptidase
MDNVEATCLTLYHLTGVRDDPDDIKGASSLYQTLMLSKTRNLEEMDRFLFVKRLGGYVDDRVDYDYSIFNLIISESEINNALWIESERIGSLQLNDRLIDRLKTNVYKRFYHLTNNNVSFRAINWVKEKVFEGTVYKTPLYGKIENIQGFDNQKIKALYNNFRNLSDIVMVISGKFNSLEIKDIIKKRFSDLEFRTRPVKKNFTSFVPRKKYVYENWTIENLNKPFFLIGIRAPSKISFDYLYFDFIRYYLLDKRMSTLIRSINHKNDLNADISYELSNYFECNALIIKISVDNRIKLEKARYILNRELAAFTSVKALSNNDLKSTKSLMEIDLKKKMRDLKERNHLIAENFFLNGDMNFVEKQISRIRKINSLNVIRIGKKYLQKENMVILNVYKK